MTKKKSYTLPNVNKQRLKNNKKRKLSSQQWLTRHLNDPYVQLAHQEGYVSRAAYKLLDIQEKYNLLTNKQSIIDLGAAPGGWTQVILQQYLKPKTKLIAIDLLELQLPPQLLADNKLNDNFFNLQGDFLDLHIQQQIIDFCHGYKIDLILSDMSPNTSGSKSVDHLRIIALLEEVINFAKLQLNTQGALVVKVFQGGAIDTILKEIKPLFGKIQHYKPPSSRQHSKELYLIAKDFKC